MSRSTKNADKRILLFTNEDDPFGRIKGATKTDMIRTTIQRAKVLHITELVFILVQCLFYEDIFMVEILINLF